jgi:hypothetical protein
VRRLHEQTGSALVAAILLMAVMMLVALAAHALVDTEVKASAGERQRETSFNLTEELLNVQVYKLSRDWPGRGTSANPYPDCATGTTHPRCPDAASVLARFGGVDVANGATWSTIVRDNNNPNVNYYDDAITMAQPHYDANGDDRVWVRAQSTVRGKRRTLVGLVRVGKTVEEMPRAVLLAGKFRTTNSGNKVIVETQGAPLQVRCLPSPGCLDYAVNKNQVSPDTTQTGYLGGDALRDDQIQRLRERAIAEGTWSQGCPATPAGELVFVEEGDCAYGNEAMPCCNSAALPGVFIVNRGSITIDGNIVFHGLIYAANRNNSNGWLVTVQGTALVKGAISIDRGGGLQIGTSALNLSFDANVFNRVISYPNAGIVQNTWRELPA